MSTDGRGTKCCRNISENFNRLSRAHERYRRRTTGRQMDGRQQIVNVNVSSRSLMTRRKDRERQKRLKIRTWSYVSKRSRRPWCRYGVYGLAWRGVNHWLGWRGISHAFGWGGINHWLGWRWISHGFGMSGVSYRLGSRGISHAFGRGGVNHWLGRRWISHGFGVGWVSYRQGWSGVSHRLGRPWVSHRPCRYGVRNMPGW